MEVHEHPLRRRYVLELALGGVVALAAIMLLRVRGPSGLLAEAWKRVELEADHRLVVVVPAVSRVEPHGFLPLPCTPARDAQGLDFAPR